MKVVDEEGEEAEEVVAVVHSLNRGTWVAAESTSEMQTWHQSLAALSITKLRLIVKTGDRQDKWLHVSGHSYHAV